MYNACMFCCVNIEIDNLASLLTVLIVIRPELAPLGVATHPYTTSTCISSVIKNAGKKVILLFFYLKYANV